MKMPAIFLATLIGMATPLTAFADEGGPEPRIHEEHHALEGLPIVLIICALIVAIGLAYGIGKRSRK